MYDPLAPDVAKIYDRERIEKSEKRRLLKVAQANRPTALRHLSQRLDTALGAFDVRSLSTRSAKVVKTLWWVPAGIAFFVLLGSIIGG